MINSKWSGKNQKIEINYDSGFTQIRVTAPDNSFINLTFFTNGAVEIARKMADGSWGAVARLRNADA